MKRFLIFLIALSLLLSVPVRKAVAQTGNQLAAVAAMMPVGTWAQVLQNSSIDDVVKQGMISGNRLGFSNSIAYDSVHNKLLFTGSDHGEGALWYLSYDIASNTWTTIGNANPPVSSGHGYDHNMADPNSGLFFIREYGIYPGGNNIYWYQGASPSWSIKSSWPVDDYINVALGTAWWNGPLKGLGVGGAKSNGAVMVYNCGSLTALPNQGELLGYDPLADSWFLNIKGFGGPTYQSSYHCLAEYSEPKNLLIFGGSNDSPNLVMKMDANQNITILNTPPWGVGIQQANMVVDPVTGNVILLGGSGPGQLYELNPDGLGTYTQLTGLRSPPAAIGYPSNVVYGIVSGAIPDLGVLVYVSCNDHSSCVMYLYKNAVGTSFATRCAMPGVIRCVGFDSDADLPHAAFGSPPYPPSGLLGQNGTLSFAFMTRDTTQKASGASSLKFTVPFNAPADVGAYYANFKDDFSGRCDGGCDIYVQYRQRFDSNYLTNNWPSGGGWKQMMFTAGDPTNSTFTLNCQADELVLQNTSHIGFPRVYNSCPGTGSSSHGGSFPLEPSMPATDGVLNFHADFALQSGRGSPYCLYTQNATSYYPPIGNCLGYYPNEWLTYEMHYHVGPRGSNGVPGAAPNDEYVQSWVEGWMARDGGHLQKFHMSELNWSADVAGTALSKIWLLAYDSNRNGMDGLPAAAMWVDELIISTKWIPEADASGSPLIDNLVFSSQPTNVHAGSTFSPTITVAANLAAGGIDTAFTGSVSLVISGCASALTGTTTQTAVSGVATFAGLGATGGATNCTIVASSTGTSTATSNAFNVAGLASTLTGPGGLVGPGGLIGPGGPK